MKTWLTNTAFGLALWLAGSVAQAVDTGATGNGSWNNPAIWTAGTVPGLSNDVYIGSTYPAGSAANATISLTQDQSADDLLLGNAGGATSGTLNLGSNKLTVTNLFAIGGTGTLTEGAGGSFTAGTLFLTGGNPLTLGLNDQAVHFQVNGSTAATTATGNVTSSVNVGSGGIFNMGADLNFNSAGYLDVEDAGSVLHMNGHNISAPLIFMGWNDNHAVTLDRGATAGSLSTASLYVADMTFNLLPTDAVTSFSLKNATSTLGSSVTNLTVQNSSTATTAATGNASGNVSVLSGSTLNMGAGLNIGSNTLDVEDAGSALHMAGNNVSAGTIYLGWNDNQAVALDRGTIPGSLAATNLYVVNSTVNLLSTDAVTNLFLKNSSSTLNSNVAGLQLQSGATATTTATGNVTGGATSNLSVLSGSTLNMGADVGPVFNFDLENTGSVVHMNGHNLNATEMYLGWNGNQAVTLDRGTTPGSLTANSLYVANTTLNLMPTDNVGSLLLKNASSTVNADVGNLQLQNGSTATTTALATAPGYNDTVLSGSTLNMGADIKLGDSLDVEDAGSAVHMNGHNISAIQIFLGQFDSHAVTLDRGTTPGSLTAADLSVYGTSMNLLPIDAIQNYSLFDSTTMLGSAISLQSLGLLTGSTATTSTTSNVSDYVNMYTGSTLNMGADLSLNRLFDVEDNGSAVHMNGHNISATSIYVGWNDPFQTVTLDRGPTPGYLTATDLYVGYNNLDLLPGDHVTNIHLDHATMTLGSSVATMTIQNSTVTTTATGTVTDSATVTLGGALNLGADLRLTGNLDVEGLYASLNGHGFNITADQLIVESSGLGATGATDVGMVHVNALSLVYGTPMSIHGGVVNNALSLTADAYNVGSVLTILETGGTGLTLNGTSPGSLTIDHSSIDLVFNSTGWGFRWQDPSGTANWISTLNGMIAAGEITLSLPVGGSDSVYDLGGYTYIGATVAPEPTSLALAGIAGAVLAVSAVRRRAGS